ASSGKGLTEGPRAIAAADPRIWLPGRSRRVAVGGAWGRLRPRWEPAARPSGRAYRSVNWDPRAGMAPRRGTGSARLLSDTHRAASQQSWADGRGAAPACPAVRLAAAKA